MEDAPELARDGRRQLVLLASLVVLAAAPAGPPGAWAVVALAAAGVLVAGRHVLGATLGREPAGLVPLLVPAVLTAGAVGMVRLVPPGLLLVPALIAFALVLDVVLRLELALAASPAGTADDDRARVVAAALGAAFAAFAGAAALVPGGLVDPAAAPPPLLEGPLALLVAADGLAGLVLGYRVAALRYARPADAAWAALTFGLLAAIGAAAVRAAALPGLLAPVLLVLALYLWDALHGRAPARRREPRAVWEAALLAILGAVVVAWTLRLAG